MSTRPPASFIQVNHSTAEQDASHSALFYLFQEVSKLASPTHSSFLDTSSPSRWLYETSKPDNVIVKREEDSGCSFQSYQHSLKEETHSSKFTTSVEAHHECRSPWKVLSMINLHCERLMHRTYAEDSDRSSVSSTAKLHKGHPAAKLLAAEADVTEQGCVTPVEDGSGDCTQGVNNCKPRCCVHVSKMKSGVVRPQTAEKTDAVIPELMKENTTSSQHQHGDKREFNFSVNGQLVRNQECVFDSFSTEQDILKVPFSKNPLPLTHIPGASKNMKLTFNLNENAPISLSKKPLTLDYNANITVTTEPQCDNQLPHPSSVLPSQCKSLQKEGNKRTGPVECTHVPTEEELASGQLKSCNESSATSKQDVQQEDVTPSLIQQWRIKTPRKQPHPSRSVDIQDPDLQGVTFRMDTEVDDSREQCRLLITSKYRYFVCMTI